MVILLQHETTSTTIKILLTGVEKRLVGITFESQAGTWFQAQRYLAIYTSWAVGFPLVLVTLGRGFYWFC